MEEEKVNEEGGDGWKRTIFIVETGSVEDSRIDGPIFDVNLNGKTNEAHGGKEEGFAESRRGRLIF